MLKMLIMAVILTHFVNRPFSLHTTGSADGSCSSQRQRQSPQSLYLWKIQHFWNIYFQIFASCWPGWSLRSCLLQTCNFSHSFSPPAVVTNCSLTTSNHLLLTPGDMSVTIYKENKHFPIYKFNFLIHLARDHVYN